MGPKRLAGVQRAGVRGLFLAPRLRFSLESVGWDYSASQWRRQPWAGVDDMVKEGLPAFYTKWLAPSAFHASRPEPHVGQKCRVWT